jgi:hypothetical protein
MQPNNNAKASKMNPLNAPEFYYFYLCKPHGELPQFVERLYNYIGIEDILLECVVDEEKPSDCDFQILIVTEKEISDSNHSSLFKELVRLRYNDENIYKFLEAGRVAAQNKTGVRGIEGMYKDIFKTDYWESGKELGTSNRFIVAIDSKENLLKKDLILFYFFLNRHLKEGLFDAKFGLYYFEFNKKFTIDQVRTLLCGSWSKRVKIWTYTASLRLFKLSMKTLQEVDIKFCLSQSEIDFYYKFSELSSNLKVYNH